MLEFSRESIEHTIKAAFQGYHGPRKVLSEEFVAQGIYDVGAHLLLNSDMVYFIVWGNARAFIEMCQKRLCNNAQSEIRELAEKIADLIKRDSGDVFDELLSPPCCRGGCPEGKMTCGKIAETRAKYRDKRLKE